MAEKLGHHLKMGRQKKFMTLRTVEERTGISNAYLSQLENGRISKPSPKVLHKLAAVYGISYSRLMDLAGYPLESDELLIKQRASSHFRDITADEEEKLLEYLEFLRNRRGAE